MYCGRLESTPCGRRCLAWRQYLHRALPSWNGTTSGCCPFRRTGCGMARAGDPFAVARCGVPRLRGWGSITRSRMAVEGGNLLVCRAAPVQNSDAPRTCRRSAAARWPTRRPGPGRRSTSVSSSNAPADHGRLPPAAVAANPDETAGHQGPALTRLRLWSAACPRRRPVGQPLRLSLSARDQMATTAESNIALLAGIGERPRRTSFLGRLLHGRTRMFHSGPPLKA